MSGYIFAVGLAVLFFVLLVWLLRSRRVREKYVAIWLLLALAVIVVAVFPNVSFWLADVVGVETPVNLLFAGGFLVVLGVCLQLSSEVSSLEEETRTLAEEVALLQLGLHELGAQRPERTTGDAPPRATPATPGDV